MYLASIARNIVYGFTYALDFFSDATSVDFDMFSVKNLHAICVSLCADSLLSTWTVLPLLIPNDR